MTTKRKKRAPSATRKKRLRRADKKQRARVLCRNCAHYDASFMHIREPLCRAPHVNDYFDVVSGCVIKSGYDCAINRLATHPCGLKGRLFKPKWYIRAWRAFKAHANQPTSTPGYPR